MADDTIQTAPEDGQAPNPPATEPETTGANGDNGGADTKIDYEKKFSESSREAQKLLDENKRLMAEIEAARNNTSPDGGPSNGNDSDVLFPGFEELDEAQQKNIRVFTESIKKGAVAEVYKDPAIAEAKRSHNERVWSEAFDGVAEQFPALKDQKADFKSKYFRPDNVPANIKDLLPDIAKIYLFDKAEDIGAQKEKERQNRLDTERSGGGDKTPKANRTLEDWHKMAVSNPAEFAKHSKEYETDLASGKL